MRFTLVTFPLKKKICASYTSRSPDKVFGKARPLQSDGLSAERMKRSERSPICRLVANRASHEALPWFKDWIAPGLMGIGMNNLDLH